MIIEFILSFILVIANTVFCAIQSGLNRTGAIACGKLGICVEILFYTVIFAALIFITGYGKSFCKIFISPKKQKTLSLYELKKIDIAISYAIKIIVCIAIISFLYGISLIYINYEDLNKFRFTFSTSIFQLLYLLFFELIFITLKSKNKTQMIKLMSDDEVFVEQQDKKSRDDILFCKKTIVYCMIFIVIILTCNFIMDIITKNKFNFSEFKNEFIRWIDFPSFIQLFLPSFVLLAISGNFKNFWKSVKVAYNDEKLSVTEMNLFVNAIQCLRSLLIFTGIGCTLTGFTGTFFHLKDNSLIGLNIQVALIPCFYSIICCLVLLLLETKILRLADGNE